MLPRWGGILSQWSAGGWQCCRNSEATLRSLAAVFRCGHKVLAHACARLFFFYAHACDTEPWHVIRPNARPRCDEVSHSLSETQVTVTALSAPDAPL